MKILIDLLYIENNKTSGVANFAFRLLEGIQQFHQERIDEFILLIGKKDIAFVQKHYPYFRYLSSDKFNRIRIPYISSFIESFELRKIIKKYSIDIYYNPFVHADSKICQCTMMGTVHDIQQLSVRKGLKLLIYRCFLKKKLTVFHKLICISKHSLNELTSFMPELHGKCQVVYNSVVVSAVEDLPNIHSLKPYILNVNTLEEYKNVLTLVKAFETIQDKIPHRLILKGKITNYWKDEVKPYLEKQGLENRVLLLDCSLSSGQMTALYTNASLFVTPSTMEGFGFTPVEAMVCGTPVISTKIPALYESTMGKATYLEDPYDVATLAHLMLQVLVSTDTSHLQEVSQQISETYSIRKNTDGILKELGVITG